MFPAADFCQSLPSARSSVPGYSYIARSLTLDHAAQHDGCTPNFSEGSKFDADIGCGPVFQNFGRCDSLSPCTSIYTAELSVSLILALPVLYILQARNYVIYSDSKAVFSAVENICSSHKLVTQVCKIMILCHRRGFLKT